AGFHLFRLAAQRLSARTEGRPVVLAVDDAHLLDEASAALVHRLAVQGTAVVVVAVRNGERVPDAIAALWKDGPMRRLDIPLLSDAAIDELLSHALPGQICELGRAELRRL